MIQFPEPQERHLYSDMEMCECGNVRERTAAGRLKPACNRCLLMEANGYESVLPPGPVNDPTENPGPMTRAEIQRAYRLRKKEKVA